MAASEVCVINPDNPTGNMYFRGEWAYCPEYKTGDVILYEGILYLSLKPNAGRPPDDNKEYWRELITKIGTESAAEETRRVLDGGFASTESNDKYESATLSDEIDGGSSSERIHVRLI